MTSLNNPLPLPRLLLFFIIALHAIPTLANSHHKTTNDLVTTTCMRTPDPTLCESELRSDPRSSKAADPEGLILIMLDVVKTRFSDSLRYVEELDPKTHDPDSIRGLHECVRLYRVVVDTSIDLAVRSVKQGDPKFGEQAMVDAGNEAEACKRAFPEDKLPSRITGQTRMLHGVSNAAASMIKTME